MVNFLVGLFIGSSLGLFFMALISVGRTEDERMSEQVNKQVEPLSLDELIMELKRQQKGDK